MNARCEEFQTMIAAGLGEFSEIRQTEEIRRHLEGCSDCREYFRALQADDELLAVFTESLRPSLSRLEARTIDSLSGVPAVCRGRFRKTWARKVCATVAVAAALCVVATLAVRILGLTGVASVGLAGTLEAMQGKAWVHSVERVHEIWRRRDGRIVAFKRPNGSVCYTDYADNVEYEYNPNSRKIVISLVAGSHVLARDETPLEMVANIIESAEKAGAKVRHLGPAEPGTSTEVIRLDYPDGFHLSSTLLTRDTATNLLLRIEWIRRAGEKMTVTFDYPDPGPTDIYALGVPADAIVHDTRPTGPAMTLVRRIQERLDRGFGDHQAILLESEIENDVAYLPMHVSVFRQKGQRKRWDSYRAFNFRGLDLPYPGEEGRWPNLSMPQVLDIVASGAMSPTYQMLFDGSRTVTRQMYNREVRVREWESDQFKAPGGAPFTHYLPSLTWPDLYFEIQRGSSVHSRTEILELPADPNRPGLVGLRLVRFAETQDYWFDPARDHVLIERIQIQQRVNTRREFVRELGQASTGVWYPRVVEVESTNLGPDGVPDRTRRWERRILLETGTTIDDALFDPATLAR